MSNLREDSKVIVNVRNLLKILPSITSSDSAGRAAWLASTPSPSLPRLVIGASEDFIVDRAGVEETARFLGVVGDTTTTSVSSSNATTTSSDTSATSVTSDTSVTTVTRATRNLIHMSMIVNTKFTCLHV
jgi:hypothetical protein